MTLEEQRKLAIECGAKEVDEYGWCDNEVALSPDSLSAYTAAVEANMREICAVVVAPEQLVFSDNEWRIRRELQEAIRSLKNE